MNKIKSVILVGIVAVLCGSTLCESAVLLDDDFNRLRPGMFSAGVIGAKAEYHYVRETAPQGNWVVSCFSSSPNTQRGWWVIAENGDAMLSQTIHYNSKHTHPFVCTTAMGSEFWIWPARICAALSFTFAETTRTKVTR